MGYFTNMDSDSNNHYNFLTFRTIGGVMESELDVGEYTFFDRNYSTPTLVNFLTISTKEKKRILREEIKLNYQDREFGQYAYLEFGTWNCPMKSCVYWGEDGCDGIVCGFKDRMYMSIIKLPEGI